MTLLLLYDTVTFNLYDTVTFNLYDTVTFIYDTVIFIRMSNTIKVLNRPIL